MKLSELPNIGEVLEKQLIAVGINSPKKLLAIEGTIQGMPKKMID